MPKSSTKLRRFQLAYNKCTTPDCKNKLAKFLFSPRKKSLRKLDGSCGSKKKRSKKVIDGSCGYEDGSKKKRSKKVIDGSCGYEDGSKKKRSKKVIDGSCGYEDGSKKKKRVIDGSCPWKNTSDGGDDETEDGYWNLKKTDGVCPCSATAGTVDGNRRRHRSSLKKKTPSKYNDFVREHFHDYTGSPKSRFVKIALLWKTNHKMW